MQGIRSSNPPVVTGICDLNKSRACHHRSLKFGSKLKYLNLSNIFEGVFLQKYRSGRPEVFLRKGVLKICCKFTGEHPCDFNKVT